mgnify:FL=1
MSSCYLVASPDEERIVSIVEKSIVILNLLGLGFILVEGDTKQCLLCPTNG